MNIEEQTNTIIKDVWLPIIIEQLNRGNEFLYQMGYTPKPLTKKERIKYRVNNTRERVAFLIAPWLDRECEW